jgi:putative nucleotidyltransferase with HDIG domain
LHDIGLLPVLGKDKLSSGRKETDSTEVSPDHPIAGADILAHNSCFKQILPIVRHHHEKFDGSGAPDGIEGEKIPLGARLITLFDHYDQMVGDGSNKVPIENVLESIYARARSQFDPVLTDKFVEYIDFYGKETVSYSTKRAKATVKEAFTEILARFKAGKIEAPVMPQVVTEVRSLIDAPNSTAEDLAAVIEKEPVISLRLIAVANSPIYRGFQEIQSVRKAIPRLGMKETLNIVIAISNKSLYETKHVQFRNLMEQLWQHSLACAYGAKLLSKELNFEDTERPFLIGLTHDIGKAILLRAFAEISDKKKLDIDAVLSSMQQAHVSVGAYLLKRWGFAEDFIKIVMRHESNDFEDDAHPDLVLISFVNQLTRNIGFSIQKGQTNLSESPAAKLLKLTPEKIEDFEAKLKELLSDVSHLF